MAKKIYIGEILEQVNSAIAALQVDMGTMSGDMASMVAELIALKTTMAQGVNEVSGVASDNLISETIADIPVNISVINTWTKGASLTSKMTGSFKISGDLEFESIASSGYTTSLGYSLDGTNWVEIDAFGEASPGIKTISFEKVFTEISVNDVIYLGAKTNSFTGNKNTNFPAGLALKYDIVDLVNDGAIIIDGV